MTGPIHAAGLAAGLTAPAVAEANNPAPPASIAAIFDKASDAAALSQIALYLAEAMLFSGGSDKDESLIRLTRWEAEMLVFALRQAEDCVDDVYRLLDEVVS